MENSNHYEYNHLVQVISNCEDCRVSNCKYSEKNGIPDRCPYLLDQIEYVEKRLRSNPDVVSRLELLADEDTPYDYGMTHSAIVARIGEQLLRCKKGEFQEKNILLLRIAALLHQLEGYNFFNYWHRSAAGAERLLAQVPELSLYDKVAIVEAIERQANDSGHIAPVSAALYFGRILSFAMHHFKKNLSPDEFHKLDDFEKQAFYTRDITFSLDREGLAKGNLVLHYNQKGSRAYGLPAEFSPELFAGHQEIIQNARAVAMEFLDLDDVDILVSTRSSVCPLSEDRTIVKIPLEEFCGKK